MSKMLKVRAKEPVLLFDGSFVIDISHTEYNKNPNKEYKVPDTPFWRERATGEKAMLELIGQVSDEPKPPKQKKVEEVKSDEES